MASKHSFSLPLASDNQKVTVIDTAEKLSECVELKNYDVLALDCEGVDLGRFGELSIVQLSHPTECFLFDVINCDRSSEITFFLKEILENPKVTKIIHDSKMDSDALWHLLGIKLEGCHDTQGWDLVMKMEQYNLNKALMSYGLQPNVERDSNVYEINSRFWATRPMTSKMIEWASGDVASLFKLREEQVKFADRLEQSSYGSPQTKIKCEEKSASIADFLRSKALCQKDNIHGSQIGLFIGRGGSNVKMLCGANLFYQFRGRRGSGDLVIYAPDDQAMDMAVRKLAPYKVEF